ncbi:unnamed protein product (macronuclear) [Paramecium tetraurelia]|uniref:Uncharacterized protein n=1 Tax=Paramecium tetraurelia TaxID=5888 RepID=A0CEL0_PARTE|nr:uncharacterized protein GSPATT00037665001 [Paramecium tetraurelia]CAK69227.1 unnamed protein product [Paramecium tetraurelia]|eukprot:XP_001436624.1 hypothetical protein (macronuclear) [Paramecium tetraurelia strain d4-2]
MQYKQGLIQYFYSGVQQQIHLRSQSNNEILNRETINQNKETDTSHSFEFKDFQQPQSSTRLTDFWVAVCLEEVDAAPCQQYFRYLHCKAWQKKEKIPKFYEKLSNRIQLNL